MCVSNINAYDRVINILERRGDVVLVKKRDVVWAVVFTLITCGIYGIYWFVKMTDEVSILSGDTSMTGIKALIFTLITCGIYHIYWNYKIGQLVYQAQQNAGVKGVDRSIAYLILSVFGLGIITYCMVQSDVNALAGS